MKYHVTRTSDWSDNKPCEEAFEDDYIRVDERNTDSPYKIPCYANKSKEFVDKDWYGEGKNHRVKNGRIQRDFDDRGWFVNINSLEELNAFCTKYGDVIIQDFYHNDDIKELEIYDDDRE
jgi:hypothetical protein